MKRLSLMTVIFSLLLTLAGAILGGANEAQAISARKTRKAKLAWEPLDRAAKYEIELSTSASMETDKRKEESTTNSVAISLVPGTYYFRIRGLDTSGKAGPWSDASPLEIRPPPPVAIAPTDGKSIEALSAKGEVQFQWKRENDEKQNLFQIFGSKGNILNRTLKRETFHWKPTEAGNFRWRVGYRSGGDEVWGPYQGFSLRPSAFPPAAEIESPAPRNKPRAQTGTPANHEVSHAAEAETWFIGRVAQSVVAYRVQDYDSGTSSSGAALVGLFSAELRWRAARSTTSLWGLSGALNLELINQNVLETNFTLPRGYARVFYTRELDSDWRLGPFLQLNVNRSGIFVVQGADQALTATITRKGAGLGVSAVYRPTGSMLLSWLALIRLDTGGVASTLPGPVDSNLGYEAGFGVALGLSRDLMMEGRLRALNESFSWPSATAGAPSSSLSDTFIIFDFGLGYRF